MADARSCRSCASLLTWACAGPASLRCVLQRKRSVSARAQIRVGSEQLAEVALPAIAHFANDHYVVLHAAPEGRVVGDPAGAMRTIPLTEFPKLLDRMLAPGATQAGKMSDSVNATLAGSGSEGKRTAAYLPMLRLMCLSTGYETACTHGHLQFRKSFKIGLPRRRDTPVLSWCVKVRDGKRDIERCRRESVLLQYNELTVIRHVPLTYGDNRF